MYPPLKQCFDVGHVDVQQVLWIQDGWKIRRIHPFHQEEVSKTAQSKTGERSWTLIAVTTTVSLVS